MIRLDNSPNYVSFGSERFTYNPKRKWFVAELSDLDIPDALPATIAIKSKRTGAIKLFRYDRALRDAEGEITVWVYRDREGTGLEVHILND